MNKPLKAQHLTHAANELAVIRAAMNWYDALNADQPTADGARYRAIADKLYQLEHACHQYRASELALLQEQRA